jgi:1-acyl-sn-glycerol-3-phosphate acyltransferase
MFELARSASLDRKLGEGSPPLPSANGAAKNRDEAAPSGSIDGPLRLVAVAARTGPMARLRRAYERGVFYGLLAVFGLSSLLWSVLAAILYPLLPRRFGEPLGQFMIMAGFRYFVAAMRLTGIIDCDLKALDTLRRGTAVVIAPNHPSLLDAVLVLSRLPRVACAAKAEIWDNAFLGAGARLAGYIRNDSTPALIRHAVLELQAGRHFLIFPEGTRSRTSPLDDFKGGFALIAKKAGAPVQTVFIESNSRFLGKGWSLFRRPEFPLVYRVRLGRRLAVEGDIHEFVDELHAYFRQELGARHS